ncbi:hypothetical protein ES703_05390 [subsurface metagenome]
MPASTNGTLKADVRSLLWYGKEKARTGKELAKMLGFKDDRQIRLAIRGIIADGLPVISSVHPPYGYYIADSPDEVMEHLGELRHRALEVLGRYKDLKIAAREILQPCQLGLL